MTLSVLAFTRDDIDDLHRLASEFSAFLRAMGDPDSAEQQLTGERILADGFGPDPVIRGYIARFEGNPVGYLIYSRDYNADYAIRVFHVCDLFVSERARGTGVGRALMHQAAEDCRAWGGKRLQWEVWRPNARAFDFYRGIGGEATEDLVLMHLEV
jgi:GNAT superfamily N-acetyltransferase